MPLLNAAKARENISSFVTARPAEIDYNAAKKEGVRLYKRSTTVFEAASTIARAGCVPFNVASAIFDAVDPLLVVFENAGAAFFLRSYSGGVVFLVPKLERLQMFKPLADMACVEPPQIAILDASYVGQIIEVNPAATTSALIV